MSTSPRARPGSEAAPAGGRSEEDLLERHDIMRVRAPNPGPLTLSGTNTWLVGRAPTWVVDPGPLLDEHVERLLGQRPAPLAAGRDDADVALAEGVRFGPFEAVATPGHARDHFALIAAGACFTGDAVLGEGSVFISPYPGAMSGYLAALERLRLRDDFDVLCPGHGPPVWEAHAKLDEYIAHRLDRENRLIAALGEDRRTVPELLDAVWSEVPEALRPLATVTLAAHLDRLEEQHALPAGVERPTFEGVVW